MRSVRPHPLPADALLARYAGTGAYTDCFVAEVARPVSHAQFIETFYTGAAFRLERLLLKWFLSRPSSDDQVRELAEGAAREFAAWRVEDRVPNQLLLCDLASRTRSWLMVSPAGTTTTLYFGSAIVPAPGQPDMGGLFRMLLGFHKLYSRVLLGSATARLGGQA